MSKRKVNEPIIVYAFLDKKGREQEFTTLDEVVAARYSAHNGYDIVERIYEYVRTLSPSESAINESLD